VGASDGYATYLSSDSAVTLAALLEEVSSRGDRLVDLRVERPTLEERFLQITVGETGPGQADATGRAER
jgi:ABC-2 type transport system ATP-binding protein